MRNSKIKTLSGLAIIVLLGTVGLFLSCKQKPEVSVTEIKLDKAALSLVKGATGKLTATVLPANAANKKITWTSAEPNIASVNQEGTVTAKAEGSAVITVKTQDGGKTASCTVTVTSVAVTGVTLNETALSLMTDETEKLTAIVEPSNATNKNITWSSSNAEIAEVDQEGNVTAKAIGEAEITVTTQDGSKTSKCTVTVGKGAILYISPGNTDIFIALRTRDEEAVKIEGCSQTELASGLGAILNATAGKIVLKGEIIELACQQNQLTAIDIQGLKYLKELNCSKNKLTSLNVQGLTYLQILNCSNNQLTGLNLQGLKSLKELNCENNQLQVLDAKGLTALEKLNCYKNQLTTLNIQGLTALKVLFCFDNKLTALDVKEVKALQKLICYNNQLTTLNVRGLTFLESLNCGHNKLTSLDVRALPYLQSISCYNNELTSLDVGGLIALQSLSCGRNRLTALNVRGLKALEILDLYNNQITALDVKDLKALNMLNCGGNKLNKDVFTKIFNDLPFISGGIIDGECYLYTEETGVTEGNYTGFTSEELKVIKDKNWNTYKTKTDGHSAEL